MQRRRGGDVAVSLALRCSGLNEAPSSNAALCPSACPHLARGGLLYRLLRAPPGHTSPFTAHDSTALCPLELEKPASSPYRPLSDDTAVGVRRREEGR
ncbi:hypothetical protein AAFF_G00011850 [Aldrovandia affinis]|uniref:Uncharacterized protein n=1 Tax=Aldrovandia affinis TaxID=143900 RepID=A0AAD7S6Z5_9TELE|nr:hypothetical protein AAFF_G00011850 [Aldrovandia affinis]